MGGGNFGKIFFFFLNKIYFILNLKNEKNSVRLLIKAAHSLKNLKYVRADRFCQISSIVCCSICRHFGFKINFFFFEILFKFNKEKNSFLCSATNTTLFFFKKIVIF